MALALTTGKYFSVDDIRKTFNQLKYSRKLCTVHSNRADPIAQMVYRQRMWDSYEWDQFMFCDEASFNPKQGILTCALPHLRLGVFCGGHHVFALNSPASCGHERAA